MTLKHITKEQTNSKHSQREEFTKTTTEAVILKTKLVGRVEETKKQAPFEFSKKPGEKHRETGKIESEKMRPLKTAACDSARQAVSALDETLAVELDETVTDAELDGLVMQNMNAPRRREELMVPVAHTEQHRKDNQETEDDMKWEATSSDRKRIRSGDSAVSHCSMEAHRGSPAPVQHRSHAEKSPARKKHKFAVFTEPETEAPEKPLGNDDDANHNMETQSSDISLLEEKQEGEISPEWKDDTLCEDSHLSGCSVETVDSKSTASLAEKSPVRKKQKLTVAEEEPRGLSPGNLFIDPKVSDRGLNNEDCSVPEGPLSVSPLSRKSLTEDSPKALKRSQDQKNVTSANIKEMEKNKEADVTSSPMRKKPKVEAETPDVEPAEQGKKSRLSPNEKTNWRAEEEFGDSTRDIMRRWRERRHFLNLQGSPRTVSERIDQDEGDDSQAKEASGLPAAEDSTQTKVHHYLAMIPDASATTTARLPDDPDASTTHSKSRLSSVSKRSSGMSHCSIRSREEMEADLDRGMRELERRLQMFEEDQDCASNSDEEDASPICAAIRKGPKRYAAQMRKITEDPTEGVAHQEMAPATHGEDDESRDRKLAPSTSGSDVLDFIREKRSRLMQIQAESIHLESDTDGEQEPNDARRPTPASTRRRQLSRGRRRSRSIGRPVVQLGAASPKKAHTQQALGRLGLCTPAKFNIRIGTATPVGQTSSARALCTPSKRQYAHQSNVCVVDMDCSDTSEEARYCPILGSSQKNNNFSQTYFRLPFSLLQHQ